MKINRKSVVRTIKVEYLYVKQKIYIMTTAQKSLMLELVRKEEKLATYSLGMTHKDYKAPKLAYLLEVRELLNTLKK
tara:strand:+ start:156 stop:386 length:231 start_codon:yes stop_codon:yes gene_type:complete